MRNPSRAGRRARLAALGLALAFASVATPQAAPPELLTIQGRLTNASGVPENGSRDIVLRLYDALAAGNQIIVDSHTAAGSNAVTVTNGIYDVSLGGGTLTDGTGPGTYTALGAVFRDYAAVYLSVQVGADAEMTPRSRVVAAGYSLNALNLGGYSSGSYLRLTPVAGQIIYADATPAWTTLAAGTSGQALRSGGAGAPTWGTLSATYGGTGIDTGASTGVPSISAGTWSVAATLGATLGGTGQSAVTTGDLLYGSAANTWSRLADVATGSVLVSGGVGVAPAWSTSPTLSGNLTVQGNTTLGNATTDTITFTGRPNSSILPSVDATYNLGSTTNRWANLYLSGNVLNSGGTQMYVLRAGDTMTGALSITAAGTGLSVTNNALANHVEARTNGSGNAYLTTELGSLPGYPANYYPTLKTDGTYLYLSAGGAYSGYFSDSGMVTRRFTDFDNTANYVDPATDSNLAANLAGGITIDGNVVIDNGAGWHRSYGATGWYNGTYGGGWYMTDATWIRSYGSKDVYCNTMIRADGGFQVDGNQVIDADAGWHRTYGSTGWYNGTYGGGWYMTDSTYIRGYNDKVVSNNRTFDNSINFQADNAVGDPGMTPDVDTWGYVGYSNMRWWMLYAANGYGTSSSTLKTDIHDLTDSEIDEYLAKLRDVRSIRYRWKRSLAEKAAGRFADNRAHAAGETPDPSYEVPLRLGFTSESLPREVVDETGENYSYGDMFGMLIAAVKALDKKVQEQQVRIDELEAERTRTAQGTAPTVTDGTAGGSR